MRRESDMPYVVIERRSSGLGGFILGALVGAAAALLYAPRSGEETRAELAEGVRRVRDRAGDQVRSMQDSVGDTLDNVRSTVNERIEQARDAFEAGRQSARDAREQMERRARDTRERIRAGIDAAKKPVESGQAPPPAEAGGEAGV